MKKFLIWLTALVGLVWALSLLVSYLLLPVQNPTNSSPTSALVLSDAAQKVLVRSCYDCHSNQAVFPWYSYMPLSSILVARDVWEGRKRLNFSEFNTLSAERQKKKLKKSLSDIKEGEMPMWIYLTLHPSAKVSQADFELLSAEFNAYASANLGGPLEKEAFEEEGNDEATSLMGNAETVEKIANSVSKGLTEKLGRKEKEKE